MFLWSSPDEIQYWQTFTKAKQINNVLHISLQSQCHESEYSCTIKRVSSEWIGLYYLICKSFIVLTILCFYVMFIVSKISKLDKTGVQNDE